MSSIDFILFFKQMFFFFFWGDFSHNDNQKYPMQRAQMIFFVNMYQINRILGKKPLKLS
jgi:hypothetical protein